jgi:hypothetical protein
MLTFLKSDPQIGVLITRHLNCHAITDFVLKVINAEDMPDGVGALAWLRDLGLIGHLFDQLDPKLEAESHFVASQTLIDIITLTYQVPQYDQSSTPQEITKLPVLASSNVLIAEMKSYLFI